MEGVAMGFVDGLFIGGLGVCVLMLAIGVVSVVRKDRKDKRDHADAVHRALCSNAADAGIHAKEAFLLLREYQGLTSRRLDRLADALELVARTIPPIPATKPSATKKAAKK
jgi:hypothetical protein